MQVTGNTARYASMVAPSCKACQAFIDSVDEVYAGGGAIEFRGSTLEDISQRAPEPPTFELTKSLPATTITRGSGASEVLPGGRTSQLVILEEKAGTWVVTYYGVL